MEWQQRTLGAFLLVLGSLAPVGFARFRVARCLCVRELPAGFAARSRSRPREKREAHLRPLAVSARGG